MTLNGVVALIFRYFTEFGSFRGQLACVKVVECTPILLRQNVVQRI